MNQEKRKAYSEVYAILSKLDPKYQKQIPSYFMQKVKENSDLENSLEYNINQSLTEQNLSPRAKEILALIFKKYFGTPSCDVQMYLKMQEIRSGQKHDQQEKMIYHQMLSSIDLKNKNREQIIEQVKELITRLFNQRMKDFDMTRKSIYGNTIDHSVCRLQLPFLMFSNRPYRGRKIFYSGTYSYPSITINLYKLDEALLKNEHEAVLQRKIDSLVITLYHEIEHYYQDALMLLNINSHEVLRLSRNDIARKHMTNSYNRDYTTYRNRIAEVLARRNGLRNFLLTAEAEPKEDQEQAEYVSYRPLVSNKLYKSFRYWTQGGTKTIKQNILQMKKSKKRELEDYDDISYMVTDHAMQSFLALGYLLIHPVIKKQYHEVQGKIQQKSVIELYEDMKEETAIIKLYDKQRISLEQKQQLEKECQQLYCELLCRKLLTSPEELKDLIAHIGKDATKQLLRQIQSCLKEEKQYKMKALEHFYQIPKHQKGCRKEDEETIEAAFKEKMKLIHQFITEIDVHEEKTSSIKRQWFGMQDFLEVMNGQNPNQPEDAIELE